jgi:hypothetical protein
MGSYRLTIRHGSHVARESFADLGEAMSALRARAGEIRGEGPLEAVKAFREYGPAKRVAARLEISTGGWLRGSEAGLDVMGDGEFVAYAGAIRKRRLEAREGDTVFDAIEAELEAA